MAIEGVPENPRPRVQHPAGGVSRTKQSDALASDINSLMAKWVRNSVVPSVGQEPKYGDFSSGLDFHTALSRIRAAQAEFMRLDPRVRKACDNDVGKFVDMVYDPARRGELEALGLVETQAPVDAPPSEAAGAIAPPSEPSE